MKIDTVVTRWLHLALHSLVLVACSPTAPWVKEAAHPPSCVPDRLLTWEDFSRRSPEGNRAAATAVRFRVLAGTPARFQVEFAPDESWVDPGLVSSWNPFAWSYSDHVLRHEQVHFAISCVATRQANAHVTPGANLHSRLMLLEAAAIRLNAQYDSETRHGTNLRKQAEWERKVQAQLYAGPLTPPINP